VDNQQDIFTAAAPDVTAALPFHAFFSLLKSNGFSVTTQQIIDANKIIINYSNSLKNEEELCLYLLPVFTGNEDEQVLFKQLFLKHFRSYIKATVPQTKKEILVEKVKKNWKKILIFYGLLGLILVALITIIYKEFTRPRPEKLTITLVSKPRSIAFNRNSFSVTPRQVLTLDAVCTDEKKKVRGDLSVNANFNWGDGSPLGSKNSHAYKLQGKYELNVFVEVMHKNKAIKYDTIHSIVLVCAEKKSLKIDYGSKNEIAINEQILLKASVNNTNQPDYINWSSAGRQTLTGYTYQVSFNKPGTYSVNCLAVYDSINSPCSMEQNVFFTVVDPAKPKPKQIDDLPKDAPAKDIEVFRKKAAPFLVPLYIILAIIFGILAILFLILSEKEKIRAGNFKKSVLDKYSKLTSAFSGKKTPGSIPFKNKNYVPVHQSEINYAARQMRKRVNDNSSFLHVGKTISRSIENNGLFQPVLLPRTRQTEYLVLIDESNRNSQLVKLFEYLAQEFKKQNILIEKYFYRTEPDICYRTNEPGSISLQKLFTRYENHVLLIFGDAYQLIYKFYPVFDTEYLALISRWQHKAIVTPVAYPDWDAKEKSILMPHIPVFPLDIEGILLMAEYLADDEHSSDITTRLNQHKSLFYKVEGFDFELIADLEKYCAQAKWGIRKENGKTVNILFQWIAALAVYPKISWEVIIAMGKTILDKYNCVTELNFTNLLRIARISWMQEGRFPDALRFELLKQLGTANELLARETMLQLFKEIPAGEIKESSLAYEEKEIQQIINEFSLYANDPVYYSAFKQSKDIFEKLWDEKKLKDAPAKLYFNNAGKSWQTTINAAAPDNTIANVGVEEYFDTNKKEETILSHLYLWLCLISLFVFVASLFALMVLNIWKHGTDRDPNEFAAMQHILSNIL
jgi:hypothetical protein